MIKDVEGLITKITTELKNFTDTAVLGLSGGADSTLVACLCLKALGKDNVYGLHLPYGKEDLEFFNARSVLLAKKLDIKNVQIPIKNISDLISSSVGTAIQILDNPNFKYPTYQINLINSGNNRARARMCLLYSVCHELGFKLKKNVRVVGTGNLSESHVGYGTKFGDDAADIQPIGQLFKSEVYQLLDYFKTEGLIGEELIDRVPSAGLWANQTDEKELGYSYNEMEPAIKFLTTGEPIELGSSAEARRFEEVCKFVESRHNANKHKHEAPPVIGLRHLCD